MTSGVQFDGSVEHFVTLFDLAFLPQGLALHESLLTHCPKVCLWVIAMDAECLDALRRLDRPGIHIIPLAEIEDDRLRKVKPGRKRGEYCWTLTPFSIQAVFARDPTACRVTYLDADLWFLRSPMELLARMSDRNSSVLITEHLYDPDYDQSALSGRFCVQFLTIQNDGPGLGIVQWWGERCLEWCFDRIEPERFGDQKYLNRWPEMIGDGLYIVSDRGSFTAPWNYRWTGADTGKAIFHHFHNFRLMSPSTCRWWHFYDLGTGADALYACYTGSIGRQLALMETQGITPRWIPESHPPGIMEFLRRVKARMQGRIRYGAIPRGVRVSP